MKLLRLTASAIALSMAGSAFAADLPSRRAPAPYVAPLPIMTWTGFYVGASAGVHSFNRNGFTTVGAPVFDPVFGPGGVALQPANAAAATASFGLGNRTGATLGAQAGYNYQFYNSFLIGLEVDANGILQSGSRGSFGSIVPIAGAAGFSTAGTGVATKRLDWLGTVRARLGYTFTPSLLAYVTGGLAVGGVKSSTVISETIVGPAAPGVTLLGGQGGFSTNKVGYAIGGGLEYMLSPSFSLKGEYLYYDLGSVRYQAGAIATSINGVGGLAGLNGNVARTRFDGQLGRVGVNYHFWSPVAAPVVARY